MHTPGPWETNAQFRANDGAFAVTQDRTKYDNPSHIAFVTFHGKAKRGQAWCTPDPEGEANARLIMAAPELLEACVGMRHILEKYGYMAALACLDLTIAKATEKAAPPPA